MKPQKRLALILVSGCVLLAGAGVARHFMTSEADGLDPQKITDSQTENAESQTESHEAAAQSQATAPLLPDGARPALKAFVDPQAENRLPADFHYQVDRVEDAEEVAAVVALLRNRSEGDTMRHEAANLLRRSGYEGLEQVLIDCLQHPEEKERFRSWAVQHLFMVFKERKDADAASASGLLVPLLDEPQPAVRREALLSLHRLERSAGPDVVQTAAAWLDDPATVDLALRILRERDARNYLPQVRAILADESAADPARIAAIVTLSAWEDHESRDALAALANLPDQPANVRLRRSAQMALERLQ